MRSARTRGKAFAIPQEGLRGAAGRPSWQDVDGGADGGACWHAGIQVSLLVQPRAAASENERTRFFKQAQSFLKTNALVCFRQTPTAVASAAVPASWAVRHCRVRALGRLSSRCSMQTAGAAGKREKSGASVIFLV